MAKLSTPELKNLISTWLDKEEYKEFLEHYTDSSSRETYSENQLACSIDTKLSESERSHFELSSKSVKTWLDLKNFIWDQFRNGNNWVRTEKYKLKDEYSYHIGFVDMIGNYNAELSEKYSTDEKLGRNCIFRRFYPRYWLLADNHRLEVITTPEDDQVIGWTVVAD